MANDTDVRFRNPERQTENLRPEKPHGSFVPGARFIDPLAACCHAQRLENRPEIGKIGGGQKNGFRTVVRSIVGQAAVVGILVGHQKVERALHGGSPPGGIDSPLGAPESGGPRIKLHGDTVIVMRLLDIRTIGVDLPVRLFDENVEAVIAPAFRRSSPATGCRNVQPQGFGEQMIVIDGVPGVLDVAGDMSSRVRDVTADRIR